MGHGLDALIDRDQGPASLHDPDFTAAYQAESAALTDPNLRHRLRYFLQAGAPGYLETFAQAFVILCGGGDPADQAAFQAAFPRCIEVVRAAVDLNP